MNSRALNGVCNLKKSRSAVVEVYPTAPIEIDSVIAARKASSQQHSPVPAAGDNAPR